MWQAAHSVLIAGVHSPGNASDPRTAPTRPRRGFFSPAQDYGAHSFRVGSFAGFERAFRTTAGLLHDLVGINRAL